MTLMAIAQRRHGGPLSQWSHLPSSGGTIQIHTRTFNAAARYND